MRAAPGAAWALAVLVAVTAWLAAVFPRAVERYEDTGLRHAVSAASPARAALQFAAPQPGFEEAQARREQALRGAALRSAYRGVLGALRPPLAADRGQSAYGVRTGTPLEAPERWLARPSGLAARFSLIAQNDLAAHARLRSGRLPAVHSPVTAGTREVEAAVSTETARTLHIDAGSVIHVPGVLRDRLAVRVTGVVEPRSASGPYWSVAPLLHTPTLVRLTPSDPDSPRYWLGALLLPPDAAPVLLGTTGDPERYWQLAPDIGALTAHDVPRLATAVTATVDGPALLDVRRVTDDNTSGRTDLDTVLTAYAKLRDGVSPLVAVAAFGTGTVAGVVLLMAGSLAAERRRSELSVLRARGASLRGLTGRLFAETAVVAVPSGALGLVGALLAVPHGRTRYAVAAAAGVTALGCVTLPLRALAAHRAVGVHSGRADLVTARPSRRRTVAELTILVLAVGSVVALRRRGADGGDALVALAPALVGVIAALVLVRLYPLPLRMLAGPTGRLRGAVGPLSLARAGRAGSSAVLPLLALLTALTTAAFGGSTVAAVAAARDAAALHATGADARVDASGAPLPSSRTSRVRELPGVRGVVPLRIADGAEPVAGSVAGSGKVTLVGVDPPAYAALARRGGLGPFDAAALRAPRAHGTGAALPALASPTAAARLGKGAVTLRIDGRQVVVRVVAVRDVTPAMDGGDFVVVDAAGLAGDPRPTALLVTGDRVDGAALRAAAGPGAAVRVRSEERAGYVDSPLQSGAERVYTAAVAAGAAYAALALLLALVRAAPERAALLARLRTMGLTRAQGRRLLVLEALPQAVLAAGGGALTGWAAIRLLAPGIDLAPVALPPPFAASAAPLAADPASLLLPALCVVVLALGVAVTQAWWTGRRGAVTELRAGDGR
ncbi:ABC transporter permease [Streptomyces sp. NPDC002004]